MSRPFHKRADQAKLLVASAEAVSIAAIEHAQSTGTPF